MNLSIRVDYHNYRVGMTHRYVKHRKFGIWLHNREQGPGATGSVTVRDDGSGKILLFSNYLAVPT